ncbi:MAG: putative esterase [Chlamydiales bacterium]|jgi:predicted esterase
MKIVLSLILTLAVVLHLSRDPVLDGLAGDLSMGYVVRYSGDGGDADRLPMLIALHGNGDSAAGFHETDLSGVKEACRIVLLKGPLSHGGGDAWPWTFEDLERYGPALDEAAGRLTGEFPTKGKPVLLGFSGSGTMAYYQALRHGGRYSLVVPVSGSLAMGAPGTPGSASGTKVIAFHGKSDGVIPFIEGDLATQTLEGDGLDVTFNEFNGDHLAFFRSMNATILGVVDGGLRSVAH